MSDEELLDDEFEEYQIMEIVDDDGTVFEFALTDIIYVDEKAYAILNLIEGDDVTSAYIVYGADIDDEAETIELVELSEEEENEISDIYFEEVLQFEEAYFDDEEEE